MSLKINCFGEYAKFHHVGIVVKSISKVNSQIHTWIDSTQKVKVGFVDLSGVNIELIEPMGENSPVYQNLQSRSRLVHLCYETPDIEKSLEECRQYNFHTIAKPVPAAAFNERRIAWVYSKHYGLVELVEADSE